MAYTIPIVVNNAGTGLTLVYTVYQADGTTVVTTGSLAEDGATGNYWAAQVPAHDGGGLIKIAAAGFDQWTTYPPDTKTPVDVLAVGEAEIDFTVGVLTIKDASGATHKIFDLVQADGTTPATSQANAVHRIPRA